MKRSDGESLFLRFRNGAPNRIRSDIVEQMIIFLKESKNGTDYHEVLNKFILPINDGMGAGTSVDSTWFRLIEECYSIFDTELSRNKFNYSLIKDVFALLIPQRNLDEKWSDIKQLIITNIDQFSMWEFSYNKIMAENRNIQREDDGTYIEYSENELYEIVGAKTLEEEKFDYILSTSLGGYGSVYNLLKFISIVFISIDYHHNPDKYPNSLNIFLPESGGTCWFLRWEWKLDRLYGYSKSGWRPYNNHCDSDWLVSDLLAEYSDDKISKREIKKFDLPSDEIAEQYEDAFRGYSRQYACAIDTDLIIGDNDEVYFDFKGKKIRWINGTTYLRTIVVVPTKDSSGLEEEERLLNEFISSLVWETEIPIRKVFQVGAAKRFLPIVSSAKNMGGIILSKPELHFNGNGENIKQILALALYKEGINSKSVYYSFLNYYKIVELFLSGNKHDIIKMINDNTELFLGKGYTERVTEIHNLGNNLGEYVYFSCRCAVAHAGRIDNTINPDAIDDYARITKDLPLIKEIAKNLIKSGKFIDKLKQH